MIHLSAEGPIQVPATDVVSFSFDRQTDYDITKPLLLDADNTSKQLSYHGYRKIVRKLIAGFRVNGLQKGDAVFCQIGNSVSEFEPSCQQELIEQVSLPSNFLQHSRCGWCVDGVEPCQSAV